MKCIHKNYHSHEMSHDIALGICQWLFQLAVQLEATVGILCDRFFFSINDHLVDKLIHHYQFLLRDRPIKISL